MGLFQRIEAIRLMKKQCYQDEEYGNDIILG